MLWFEAASRLRINLEKSELNAMGEVECGGELAAVLGCQVGGLPSTWLPLGATHKSLVVWDMFPNLYNLAETKGAFIAEL